LHTDIQHFEVDVAHHQAKVEIYARLVSGDGRIVADKTFSATAATASDQAPNVAAAISNAFAQVIHDIVIWVAPKV
ncbi:MAG TPA: ABC-type transport auxiliary lipoprotein family protein, partial [Methylovirgula sp.]